MKNNKNKLDRLKTENPTEKWAWFLWAGIKKKEKKTHHVTLAQIPGQSRCRMTADDRQDNIQVLFRWVLIVRQEGFLHAIFE